MVNRLKIRKARVVALFVALSLILSACNLTNVNKPPDGGVFRSKDGGEGFTQVVRVDDNNSISKVNILTLVIDPYRVDTVFAGTRENGIYKTDNGGKIWQHLSVGANLIDAIALNPEDTTTIYAAGQGGGIGKIFKSVDAGVVWQEVYSDPTPASVIRAIAIDRAKTSTIYASTGSQGIIKSMDSGKSWFLLSWNKAQVSMLLGDPHYPERLYIGTADQGLFRSDDSGKTFHDFPADATKFPGANHLVSFAVDPLQKDTIYAGSSFGLLKSTDGGTTWSRINILIPPTSLPVRTITIDPKNSRTLFVSTANTLYKSVDAGATWTVKGLPTSRVINAMAINPANTQYMYIAVLFEK